MAKLKGKLNVFINGGAANPPVFQITPERWAAAAKRHKAVAKRINVTIGPNFDDLTPIIGEVDAMLGFRYPTELIRTQGKRVKWMHTTGAGVEHLMPLNWLPKGAVLTNNRGVHEAKTGESALMAMMMMNNRMAEIMANQRNRRWEQIFSPPLKGQTVLILGVGELGGSAARTAKRFGLKVVGVRRTGGKHPAVDKMVKPDKLMKVLPEADHVLVTLPVTSSTRKMIGAKQIAAMKKTASLINFGRSAVVDYEALRAALNKGHLVGAFLDVFDQEPLPASSPLWHTERLVMTPHCTSDEVEEYIPKTLDLFFENLGRLMDGRTLKNLVSAEREY